MIRHHMSVRGWGVVVGALVVAVTAIVSWAQQAPEHAGHGTPEGWTFAWPVGNPAAGREVFVKLECYSCHEVKGEQFRRPDPIEERGNVGPELSGMAPLHTAEYFAEAIINPDAVVEDGKGYRASDGKSKMPSYNDLMTVQEVIDLVAYIKSLAAHGGPAHGTAAPQSGGHGGSHGPMMPGGRMPGH